jgi:membrane protein
MPIDRHEVIAFVKRLRKAVSEDDVSGAAAELAYRFFLALFPFFIFLAALGGFIASISGVQNPTDEIMDMVGQSLPADSASVLRTQLQGVIESQNAGLLSIGILGAIWASSSGVGALMKNMNRIHGVGESRSTVARIAIALGLTILGAGIMVLAFVVLFVGQLYGPDIASEIGLEDTAATLIALARWPIALVLILMAVGFMYWLAPNSQVSLKWISSGAVFFSITWVIATLGFGIYVSHFSSYNQTYGTLGGVVVLLIWFYLTAFLLLLGAEINSVIAQTARAR